MGRRRTPKRANEAECRDCLGGYHIECLSDICYLNPRVHPELTPLERIKKHCQHCAPDRKVEDCEIDECPLWHFRFGTNQRMRKDATPPDKGQYQPRADF